MPLGDDLTGKVYGHVHVLGLDTKQGNWFCKCLACGAILSKPAKIIIAGKADHNGCKGNLDIHAQIDEINKYNESLKEVKEGDVFGLLTVTGYNSDTKKYICRCQCGNVTEVLKHNLTKPHGTRSCGCYRKPDHIGKKVGKLTVIGSKKEGKRTFCECECECGNTVFVRTDSLFGKKPQQSCGKCGYGEKYRTYKLNETCFINGTQIAKIKFDKDPSAANKSGVVGVNWDKSRNKWMAGIRFKGKKYNLGRFDDFELAVQARKEAEKQIFGDFLSWYEEYKKE